MQTYDLLILGAGFAGASAAYYLSQTPSLKIAIIEKENQLGEHASGLNAGLFRQAVLDTQILSWTKVTYQLLNNPPLDWKDRQIYQATGSLFSHQAEKLKAYTKVLQACQIPHEVLAPESLKAYSWKLPSENRPWLFLPQDGLVATKALLKNLMMASQARGVELKLSWEAKNFSRQKGLWKVENKNKESLQAKVLINAAGAWSAPLAEEAQIKPPSLQAYRRHLFVAEENNASLTKSPYYWDLEKEIYFRPHNKGLLLCSGDEEAHPASRPKVDEKVWQDLQQIFHKSLPQLHFGKQLQAWACLRTKSETGKVLVDWDQEAPNYFWIAGLGGHGLSASLGIGKEASKKIIDKV